MNSLPGLGSRRLGILHPVPHGCDRSFSCNVSGLPAASNKDSALSSARESTTSLLFPPLSAFHKTGRSQELLNLLEMHRWGWRGESQSRRAEHGCVPCFLTNTQARAEKASKEPQYFSETVSGRSGCCSYGRLMLHPLFFVQCQAMLC